MTRWPHIALAWVSEWVSEYTSPSTHYRSLRRRVFPVSHLHWYWQPNRNNQETEHTMTQLTQNKRTQKETLTAQHTTERGLVAFYDIRPGNGGPWELVYSYNPEPAWGCCCCVHACVALWSVGRCAVTTIKIKRIRSFSASSVRRPIECHILYYHISVDARMPSSGLLLLSDRRVSAVVDSVFVTRIS